MLIDLEKHGKFLHPEANCKGQNCPIHNPSDHKMIDWPMNLRLDPWAFPLIERICIHGVGHPDPDSAKFMDSLVPDGDFNIHGCDGCCHSEED